ncbi:hypothetical protein RclHR1_21330002 [Rhizophagus clarus]|uniref:Uncharacterized protein n=1 Tax=Rhizophagus clarus TaxID=94130 RepID=A0A2Z6RLN1_9GLOM|nr:hypothetical protein RclHR1_21330002 [Rhizophagus clarus]
MSGKLIYFAKTLQLDFIRSLGQVPDSPFPFLLSFPFTLSFFFSLPFVFSIKNLNIGSRTPFDVPELSCRGSSEYFEDIFEGLEFHGTSKIVVSQMLSEWDIGLRRFKVSERLMDEISKAYSFLIGYWMEFRRSN